MITLGQQKIGPLSMLLQIIIAATVVLLCLLLPDLTPFILAGAAGSMILFYWGIKWDVTLWVWFWVLSYGLLDWPDWKFKPVGFFNLTIPRLIYFATIIAFVFRWISHQQRFRFDRLLLYAMLFLLVYVGLSAQITGWHSNIKEISSAPYFRYLGSIVFPFVIFYLLYNTNIAESEIKRGLLLLTAYGWYAIYIGYLQAAALRGFSAARALIWPGYINDLEYGIHADRARGAFMGASPQAVFLVLLFFVDLYLIRKLKGVYRVLLILQTALIPAALYFTGVRSAFVGFAVCLIIWTLFSFRGIKRLLALSLILLVAGTGIFATWDKLSRDKRLTQDTISGRIDLFKQTMHISREHPWTGVGFGHFVDAQQELPRNLDYGHHVSGVLVEHNLFLGMLAETGVIGLLLTVAVFVLLLQQSIKLYRKIPPRSPGLISREFVVLFWVVFANYMVDAMFRDPLWDVFANGLLWSIAGLMVCCNRMLEPTPLELPIVPIEIKSEV